MWLALILGTFIVFSAYGPLQPYGVFAGPSEHLWQPSLAGLAFAIAVAVQAQSAFGVAIIDPSSIVFGLLDVYTRRCY